VTLRVLVSCNGTREDRPSMALESCRAYLPIAPKYLPTSGTIDPDHPITRASLVGWTQDGSRDLCPACTRGRRSLELQRVLAAQPAPDLCAHTSSMRLGEQRVCADCGVPR
jgi:hypothetical protein